MKSLIFFALVLQAGLVVCEVAFSLTVNDTTLQFDSGNYTEFFHCLCTTNLTCTVYKDDHNSSASVIIKTTTDPSNISRSENFRSMLCQVPKPNTPFCAILKTPNDPTSIANPNKCKVYKPQNTSMCPLGIQLFWNFFDYTVVQEVIGLVQNETCSPDPTISTTSTTVLSTIPSSSIKPTAVDTMTVTATLAPPVITPTPTPLSTPATSTQTVHTDVTYVSGLSTSNILTTSTVSTFGTQEFTPTSFTPTLSTHAPSLSTGTDMGITVSNPTSIAGSAISSLTMGQLLTTVGQSSTTIGQYTTPLGPSTTTFGQSTIIVGQSTTTLGHSTTLLGQSTTIVGQSSETMVQSSETMGQSSAAIGQSSATLGQSSATMGQSTTIVGQSSETIGQSSATVMPSTTFQIPSSFSNPGVLSITTSLDITSELSQAGAETTRTSKDIASSLAPTESLPSSISPTRASVETPTGTGPTTTSLHSGSVFTATGATTIDASSLETSVKTPASIDTTSHLISVTHTVTPTSLTAEIAPTATPTNSETRTLTSPSRGSATATTAQYDAAATPSTLQSYLEATHLESTEAVGATSSLAHFSTMLHPSITDATTGLATSSTPTISLPHPTEVTLTDATLGTLLTTVSGLNVSKTNTVSQLFTSITSATSATMELSSSATNITSPIGYNTAGDGDRDKIIAIVVGVVAGLMLIVLIVVAVICCRRFQQGKKYRTMENGSTGQRSDSSGGSQDGSENNTNSEAVMKNLANFDGVIPRYPSYKDAGSEWNTFKRPYFTLIDIGTTTHKIIKGSTPDPIEFVNPAMDIQVEGSAVNLSTFKPQNKASSLKSVHFENALSDGLDPGTTSSTLGRKGRVVKSVKFKNPGSDGDGDGSSYDHLQQNKNDSDATTYQNFDPPPAESDYATVGFINPGGPVSYPSVTPPTSSGAGPSNGDADVTKKVDDDDYVYSSVVPRSLRGLPEISQIRLAHAEESTHF